MICRFVGFTIGYELFLIENPLHSCSNTTRTIEVWSQIYRKGKRFYRQRRQNVVCTRIMVTFYVTIFNRYIIYLVLRLQRFCKCSFMWTTHRRRNTVIFLLNSRKDNSKVLLEGGFPSLPFRGLHHMTHQCLWTILARDPGVLW